MCFILVELIQIIETEYATCSNITSKKSGFSQNTILLETDVKFLRWVSHKLFQLMLTISIVEHKIR